MNNAQSNKIHVAFSSGVCVCVCGRQTRWTLDTQFIINSNSLNSNGALCIAMAYGMCGMQNLNSLCMRACVCVMQNGWYLFSLQFWQTAATLNLKIVKIEMKQQQTDICILSVNIYWRRNGFGGTNLQNYYLLCVLTKGSHCWHSEWRGRREAIE